MSREHMALIALIRAQPWAIIPEYLEAIEALALRAMDHPVLAQLRSDGHTESGDASRTALAAVGQRLEGTATATVRDGAAVIPMLGAIFPRANMISASSDGTSLDVMMRDLRVALASDAVDRIVFLVDSPGGVVSGLGEASDAIRAATKPTTAFVTGQCASAAYWLASQTGEIVMDRVGYAGSIGVVLTLSRQEGPDANGRRTYEITSQNAPLKRADPSTDDGRTALEAEVNTMEQVFLADVARGRGVSVDKVAADFGRGGMLTAADAVAAGMADRIGTLESVLSASTGRTRQPNTGRRALAAAQLETRRRAAVN